jgi:hypothetical protein
MWTQWEHAVAAEKPTKNMSTAEMYDAGNTRQCDGDAKQTK